jgi:hypothetical protein
MAINRISGNILQDDLRRGANLAIQGNLIYFDVSNDRVGILTSTPQEDFDVDGNLRVGNVKIYEAGNIDAGNVWINNLQDPIANSDAATKNYVDSTSANVNITITDGANTQQVFNNSTISFLAVANQTTVTVAATDNVTIGLSNTVVINDSLDVLGNVAFGNITAVTDIQAVSLTVTGNVAAGNITVTDDLLANNISATGNITGENVTANQSIATISVTATGNIYFGDTLIGNTWLGNPAVTISTLGNANITLEPGLGLVDIDSTSGLVIPVGNTAQRPASAVTGTLRYNTDIQRVELYDGGEWDEILSDVSAQIITPTGNTAVYTLDRSSTDPATLVAINGVVQLPGIAYSIAGNTITFAETPLTTDIIDIRFL